MTATEELMEKTTVEYVGGALPLKPQLAALLNGWAKEWSEKACLDTYESRVDSVRGVTIRGSGKGYNGDTNVEDRKVIVYAAKGLPERARKSDKVNTAMGEPGLLSGPAEIACIILFEMGNCEESEQFLRIKQAFHSAGKTLHQAGQEFCDAEAQGTVGYVKLMRAIETATDRPYQANRDLHEYRDCRKPENIKVHFGTTPHNPDEPGFTSIQGYTFELVTKASKAEILSMLTALGARSDMLGVSGPNKTRWNAVISWLADEFGVSDGGGCGLLYDVVTEIIANILRGGYPGGHAAPTDKNWLLDADMKRDIYASSVDRAGFKNVWEAFATGLGGFAAQACGALPVNGIGGSKLTFC